jgi:serine/threonine protein kinase
VLTGSTSVEVNWRADIWSLAMVMAEILSGEVPFDTSVCRSMGMEQFIDAMKLDMRPAIPSKIESAHPWLIEMVSTSTSTS